MTNIRLKLITALAVALPLIWAPTGYAVEPSPGITDSTVTIGGSYPYSGVISVFGTVGKAARAYFNYVNANGGVKMADGKTRKIKFITYDDAYLPARTVANARRLVDQDKVFTLFDTIGTPTSRALIPFTNSHKVPLVFIESGSSIFGDYKRNPWVIGWKLTMPDETAAYVDYLKANKPHAKVAVLMQNDDYGKEYLKSFKRAIVGSDIKIVAIQTYNTTDPTVDPQVEKLAASDANVFFNVSTPKAAAQAIKEKAQLGWHALQLLNDVSNSIDGVLKPAGLANSAGIISAGYMKPIGDPHWASKPDMIQYIRRAKKYGHFNVQNQLGEEGWTAAQLLVYALEHTKAPTRKAFMESVRSISHYDAPLLLPKIYFHTSQTDGFPMESLWLMKFNGKQWKLLKYYSFVGKTPVIHVGRD